MRFKLSSLLASGFLLISANPCLAQDVAVNTVDARASKMAYRPNEVIVKFKDDSKVDLVKTRSSATATLNTAAVKAVDNVFKKLNVVETSQLMPLTQDQTFKTLQKSFNGKTVEVSSVKKAFKITFDSENFSVNEAIKELKQLEDVEYAEPNYIIYTLETETPDDPYYSLQYGLDDINIPQLWPMPVIQKDGPIIAILDTGVDITHPDLAANIWVNQSEANGATGYDDDNNGYKDDINGWDFVNQTGAIYDYNGHGTHCAGIAAACGFNGIGIVGANPDARIMPITVMQSNGQGDIATIIKGIDYAVANGADIISMSIGGYAESIAYEEALARAYQKCVIVAAAGNDGYCLNHAHPEKGQQMPMPIFPGAYSFVLGVQASSQSGGLASFSNYDDDGAAYSSYGEEKLYNYELTVPGVSIMSTYPGGGYKQLNGTSMATPLVAGALSRLLQTKEYINKEELFGDLIHSVTDKGNLDIFAAYNISDANRTPEIQFVTFDMVDSDGDGRADAGEIVEFYPVIRNSWGTAKNIIFNVECAETQNTSCEIIAGSAEFGLNLSSYGKGKALNPVKIKFNDDIVDGRIVRLKFTASADNTQEIEQELEVTIENGVEIGGMITKDLILEPNVNYIVTSKMAVPDNVSLTIKPGTKIQFKDGTGISFSTGSILNCIGEPGKMITFTSAPLNTGDYVITSEVNTYKKMSYVIIENSYNNDRQELQGLQLENSIIRNCGPYYILFAANKLIKCQIYNNNCDYFVHGYGISRLDITDCNVIGNSIRDHTIYENASSSNMKVNFLKNSNVYGNYSSKYGLFNYEIDLDTPFSLTTSSPNYWGTSLESNAREGIWDLNKNYGFGHVDLSNMLQTPNSNAHGIVWKVVVNDKDAQDEFDQLAPLGVGKHKFEVYFNRPMNKEVAPTIAMGVRPPYTSVAIGENGSWNTEGTVYTAYLTINGKANYDGLNRIYVAGAEDNEYFPIPVEDSRFNVLVQAAGSLSDGFVADAGLGRVNLEWENTEENFDDMLGINMYRYEINSEGLAGDTIQINKQILESNVTTLTDYDVKPRQTYAYFYKVMRTDLVENSPSKTVAVTPLTATQGDANGSGDVDVADVITTVNFASGLDPKPFIFEAADMNTDNEIDILDVVNIIRTILSPSSLSIESVNDPAYYFVDKNGMLYIETPVALAGIQLNLSLKENGNVEAAELLNGFEKTGAWVEEGQYKYMVYSLAGKYLEPGIHTIGQINGLQNLEILLSDVNGQPVEVETRGSDDGTTAIDSINSDESAKAGIYTITGIKVGNHLNDLEILPHGIYVVNGHKVVK